jgi:hypothetical protein
MEIMCMVPHVSIALWVKKALLLAALSAGGGIIMSLLLYERWGWLPTAIWW